LVVVRFVAVAAFAVDAVAAPRAVGATVVGVVAVDEAVPTDATVVVVEPGVLTASHPVIRIIPVAPVAPVIRRARRAGCGFGRFGFMAAIIKPQSRSKLGAP
jgi:hypothetical protein